jgi:3-methyladenine DNA glycosylase/8-oxoguanine DNA glycosylase
LFSARPPSSQRTGQQLLAQHRVEDHQLARLPGRRVPRTVDPDELAVRAVLGQQVSTAAADALPGIGPWTVESSRCAASATPT